MIRRTSSLPVLPSLSPAGDPLKRRHSSSGAIPGSPVHSVAPGVLPSAPVNTAEPDRSIVAVRPALQEGGPFEGSRFPPEVVELIVALLGNPRETQTAPALRAALNTFKQMSEVSRSFNRFAVPLRHATFLRLLVLRCVKVSFDSLFVDDLDLPRMLDGMAARSGLSRLQCLSHLVNGSLLELPPGNEKAFHRWLDLIERQASSAAKDGGDELFKLLPALIAVCLGQMLGQGAGSAVQDLMKQLVEHSRQLPDSMAEPLLIEALVLTRAKEIGTNTPFMARCWQGGETTWETFSSAHVRQAMQSHGTLTADTAASLQAVAQVLALKHAPRTDMDAITIKRALEFLASYPHPLMGCLAQALDIIGRMTGKSARIEELLAECTRKLASHGLSMAAGAARASADGAWVANPTGGGPQLVLTLMN